VSYANASFFFFFFFDFFNFFCDLKFSPAQLFLRIHSFVVRSLRARETTNNKGKIEKYARRGQRRAFTQR
jgi:hypothetical protein